VSLVPALTEMLFAVGAGPQVVGVSSYDEFPAEVKTLPKVGALLDPDTERVLALRPDLVIVYGSQSELQTQLERAGIHAFGYRHGGVGTILGTIRDLGAATGHRPEADRLAASLQSRLDAVRAKVKDRPRPRVLLVFERQPRAAVDASTVSCHLTYANEHKGGRLSTCEVSFW
jgi:iron complex transport system substrate-binding protein